MAEKTLRTRIALLYKTYEEWQAQKDFVPKKGEVCICEVPVVGVVASEPAVLIKVGDGTNSFENLPWLSGLAADVYAWAKKEALAFADLDEEFITRLDEHISGRVQDTNTKYQFRKIEDTANYQLQSKELEGDWVDVEGQVIEIPQFDPAALIARIEAVEAGLAAEIVRAQAEEAKKVDKRLEGTNGVAEIFNERDGGGAHFIHNDGSESFVGVNDGGKDGMMAQIYADVQEDGQWVGSRINVFHNGIYYVSKAAQKAGAAKDDEDREIATIGDIKALGKPLHFVGIAEILDGETPEQAVERVFPIAEQTIGAVAIAGSKEFVAAGSPLEWKEFGDVSAYATKAELEAAVGVLQAEIAKKVDKELVGAEGTAYMFNEADGGGAKFVNNDGVESFVGVNDGGADGIAAQIYADKLVDGKWQGAKLDVTNGGIYYTVGNQSAAERDIPANEIATIGDIDDKVGVLANIAHTGNVNDLIQTDGDILILDCNLD